MAEQNTSVVIQQLPQNIEGVFKDSYIFEFLDLPIPHKEKDLQQALVASLKDFILELGMEFSFVGQEYSSGELLDLLHQSFAKGDELLEQLKKELA